MVQVRVAEGVLEGEFVESDIGGKYYSFKGIPYAEPPVGDLRFKAPQPTKSWKGVRSAKEFGPICMQYDMFTNKILDGSEDCLYLNVYSPDITPKNPLPVMFWIHGGGFLSGSGNDDLYGPEFLVRHGVILVTINYRLEVLGFLCLDTEDVPGNAGMKDQVAALRWVKKNIISFGGDPDNITIFGESAGAGCVSSHLISPMSKGLFRRAIVQSGSSKCWWALTTNPRERARLLARKMGLDSDDDKELYNFFKSQPTEQLIFKKAVLTWEDEYKEHLNIYFTIVNEKKFGDNERFFYSDLTDLSRNSIHEGVEVMTGYTKDEGLLWLCWQSDFDKILYEANFIAEYFVPRALTFKCPLIDKLEVARRIRKYYFNEKSIKKEKLDPLVKYFSMDMFIQGMMKWVKTVAATKKNKIYLYTFSCISERNVMSNVFGANHVVDVTKATCHADDLAYLFPLKAFNLTVDKDFKSYKMINNVTKLWTNFAKCGNPTPDSNLEGKWNPYTLEGEQYLDIGERLVAGSSPNKEEVEFWEKLLSEYEKYVF
ncbi:unnamed protein product [Parnassius apollo]|uniref:Carboxylic ester hydrolase n=1 Tax=Parnassius apollo TaxID=110799 RepID=A0A8S3W198_PARAO|nr:unnamed protein product [Parnassius apollo]